MSLPLTTPLSEVIAWVVEQAEDRGANCPACGQHAKVYKRTINSGMAQSLVEMYREAGTEFVYVPEAIGARSREEGKLAYWGLVEEQRTRRTDGGRRGWWRVTDQGELFLRGQLLVPKYAHVYNGEALRHSGPFISITDCIRNRFNFAELMNGPAPRRAS